MLFEAKKKALFTKIEIWIEPNINWNLYYGRRGSIFMRYARNRRIFGGLFFPWWFELLRIAQPQLCCVPDLGQAARSAFVCKPTRLADGRIPYDIS